ncbi:rolling circle replication-associated protein [Clostridium ihumii]|uniref:rolling circle replication-associated protein n=1 Tax=Clostridium ihumii TaxID=1470356 RepID=UPI00055768DE|nr:hypothetical protein [Clostridium ihumii]
MSRSFMREKKIYCGSEYMEVDIIPRTQNQETYVKGKRSKKVRESLPKQKDLNDKNSKRRLVQIGNANFGIGDYHVSLTYTDANRPKTPEEAEIILINHIRRIKRKMKKEGLGELKYIVVTEYYYSKNEEENIKIHHHLIMNGGLDRNTVEDLWCKRRKRGEKKGESLGYVNADRLQPNENGIEAMCKYIVKRPQNKKSWSGSQNLIRPCSRTNDNKYSKRKVEKLAKDNSNKKEFEKIYPQYEITSVVTEYYEDTGWHIYLKMWKRKE